MQKKFTIRFASEHDLHAIHKLEELAFANDRFTQEQIHYLLTESRATNFVIENKTEVVGAACVLWRKSHQSARLYNISINPAFQGNGLGIKLMESCELEATRRGCKTMTLEVRADNLGGIKFYERLGYTLLRTMTDYYEDGCSALKMSKALTAKIPNQIKYAVPYVPQTLDFTCGPACVMMALKYFYPETELTRALEMILWKEATLIFMTSGIGGTVGFGLAYSAIQRKLSCRMVVSTDSTPHLKSVRTPEKKEIMKILHTDLKKKAKVAGLSSSVFEFGMDEIISGLYQNLIPIVLISTYRLTGDKVPHWVVVTGFDKDNIFIHDPDIASYKKNHAKAKNIKIAKSEFLKMTRYGKEVYRCLLLVGKK